MIYVLQVLSGKELIIRDKLNELGIRGIVPESFRYKRYKEEWHGELDIIFKGYVFVEMDFNAENYYLATGIDGVVKLLSAGGTPVPLSFMEEEYIRALNSDDMKAPAKISFDENNRATIVSEILKKFETKITKIDKHKRCAEFALNILNKKYLISLGIDIV